MFIMVLLYAIKNTLVETVGYWIGDVIEAFYQLNDIWKSMKRTMSITSKCESMLHCGSSSYLFYLRLRVDLDWELNLADSGTKIKIEIIASISPLQNLESKRLHRVKKLKYFGQGFKTDMITKVQLWWFVNMLEECLKIGSTPTD